MNTVIITQEIEKLILSAAVHIEESAFAALKSAAASEENALARWAAEKMTENNATAIAKNMPVCQDTGMCVVNVSIGDRVRLQGDFIYDAINEGVRKGYKNLRSSVLDPVTRENTGDNTPAVIHTVLHRGSGVKISVMLKGFGSENTSRLYMLNPAEGINTAKKLIVQTVREAGGKPCPPVIVGVGLGGTMEKCCMIAKEALLRPVGSVNPDNTLSSMEFELLQSINGLDIGVQGWGGKTTALAVHINKFPTHISSLPVAVNIQCHASRTASSVIKGV